MADLFGSATAGLRAASTRAAIVADNIVNARTTRPIDPPVDPAAAAAAYFTPSRAVQTTGPTGQPVVNRVPIDPPYQPAFDPGHPDANADGLIGVANVNLAASIVELAQAEHAYKASIAVLNAANEMSGKLFDSLT